MYTIKTLNAISPEELLNTPGKLAEMGANAKTLGNPHSLDLITEKLMELMKN